MKNMIRFVWEVTFISFVPVILAYLGIYLTNEGPNVITQFTYSDKEGGHYNLCLFFTWIILTITSVAVAFAPRTNWYSFCTNEADNE